MTMCTVAQLAKAKLWGQSHGWVQKMRKWLRKQRYSLAAKQVSRVWLLEPTWQRKNTPATVSNCPISQARPTLSVHSQTKPNKKNIEDIVWTPNRIVYSHKGQWNVICSKMKRTAGYYFKWEQTGKEKKHCMFSHIPEVNYVSIGTVYKTNIRAGGMAQWVVCLLPRLIWTAEFNPWDPHSRAKSWLLQIVF